jgi:hypothetical protein
MVSREVAYLESRVDRLQRDLATAQESAGYWRERARLAEERAKKAEERR